VYAARKCITHKKVAITSTSFQNHLAQIFLTPDTMKPIRFKLHCRINKESLCKIRVLSWTCAVSMPIIHRGA